VIKTFSRFIGSTIIAFIINFFIFVALFKLSQEKWIAPFILFSFLMTIFLVYKMLKNSELANTDGSMPLERRIKIKKFDLAVEIFFYTIIFLFPISFVLAVGSLSIGTGVVLVIFAIGLLLKIRKAIKIKYDVIQELSKTKS
jgi:uncharacterized MnhB-related membrane protein